MSLFETTDWAPKLQPIIDLYRDKKHPLDYENLYQLMVMVILSPTSIRLSLVERPMTMC